LDLRCGRRGIPEYIIPKNKKKQKIPFYKKRISLTLSYSSEGSPALAVFRPHYF
jgi:hypothetical protein